MKNFSYSSVLCISLLSISLGAFSAEGIDVDLAILKIKKEVKSLNKEVLGLYNLDDRIIVVSYGEESPILTGSNEEAWEKNRRVEFSYY